MLEEFVKHNLFRKSLAEFAAQDPRLSALKGVRQYFKKCGGFLRAINELHAKGKITAATHATFEQWIRGDFIKQGRSEDTLLTVLKTLCEIGVSQASYGALVEHAGRITKETLMDYCLLLERMDIAFNCRPLTKTLAAVFPKKPASFILPTRSSKIRLLNGL